MWTPPKVRAHCNEQELGTLSSIPTTTTLYAVRAKCMQQHFALRLERVKSRFWGCSLPSFQAQPTAVLLHQLGQGHSQKTEQHP
jgi:hypothetical protein